MFFSGCPCPRSHVLKVFFLREGIMLYRCADPEIALGVEEIPGDKLKLGGEASDLRVKGVF